MVTRVGIVGFSPPVGWAANAHVPALRHVGAPFEIRGVSNSTIASSTAAALSIGVQGFANHEALAECPDIDLMVVTVKVPHHAEVVRSAFNSGKAVLCEWPLARNYAEAIELRDLASSSGKLAVVGTQAVYAPAVRRLRELVDSGQLGDILSVRLSGYGMTWGRTIEARNAYLLDRTNGATMLSVAVGHALAALRSVLGPIASVQAHLANRQGPVLIRETGEQCQMTSPDYIQISALTRAGVPIAIVYAGGPPRGPGMHLQVDGSERSARITGPSGLIEMSPLTLEISQVGGAWDVIVKPVENALWDGVAQLYRNIADVLGGGPAGILPTFEDSLHLHRTLAAIENAADSGCTVII